MKREGAPVRSISAHPEKARRSRGAGFVWVAGLALTAYLGTAVASVNRERAWENFSLPEDGAAVSRTPSAPSAAPPGTAPGSTAR